MHSIKVLDKHILLFLGFSASVLDKKVDDMSHMTENEKKKYVIIDYQRKF